MKNGRAIGLTVILVPVLAVASCIFLPVPPVNDLTLVSVDVVAQSDIPKHDKWWDEGIITEPLVRVTFSSSYDFQRLARRWNYYIGQQTAYCDGNGPDRQNQIKGFPDVYDHIGRVNEYAERESSADPRGRILYHVYFDAERHGNVNFKPYDLIHEPHDICIQMNGHNEIAGEIPAVRFRSNVLVIPKEVLTAALVRAKMRSQ